MKRLLLVAAIVCGAFIGAAQAANASAICSATLDAPAAGTAVRGAVDITWTAGVDCDGTESITLAVAEDGTTFADLATVPITDGSYSWDTTAGADGLAYVARITVVDSGLDASSAVTVDNTAPAVTFDGASPAANSNGWNNGDVTLSWTCADATSGPSALSDSATLSSEGANQSATGNCSDLAGNTASLTSGDVSIDLTAPAISFDGASPAANGEGWNNTDVTLSWSCTDALSGATASSDSASLSAELAGQSATGSCSDNAGNAATSTDGSVSIDKTEPVIAFDGASPAANADGWNNGDVALSWTCADTLSGASSLGNTATLSAEGAHQGATGSCSDLAGNTASSTDGDVSIDLTAPAISFDGASPAANGEGWNNGDVSLSWTCTDALAGASAASDSATLSSEGANQSATGNCSDLAGNTASSTDGDVSIDKTAPAISFDGPSPAANAAGWNNTDVALSWTCSDDLSGAASTAMSATLSTEATSQSATGTCADVAGNSASSTDGDVNIDKTAPALSFDGAAPAANGAGWNTADVSLSWSCVDGLSGVDAAPAAVTLSTEGAHQSASAACSDVAGNSASSTDGDVSIDKSAPALAFVGATPAANGNGWNNTDVTLTWSCSDAVSGVAAGPAAVTLSAEGVGQSGSASCADVAGNTASSTNGAVSIDKTAPAIAFVSKLPSANLAGWNNSNVTVKWSCADTLSGASSSTTAATLTTEGASQSLTGTCSDKAGNTASNTRSGIKLDKTAPTIVAHRPAPNGSNGWFTSDVTVSWDCADTLSGAKAASVSKTLTTEGAGQALTGQCADVAGNVKSDRQSAINLDKTAASASLNATQVLQRAPNAPIGGKASDNMSGVSSISVRFEDLAGTIVATRAAVCDSGCGTQSASWRVAVSGITPGLYRAIPSAGDVAGNPGADGIGVTVLIGG